MKSERVKSIRGSLEKGEFWEMHFSNMYLSNKENKFLARNKQDIHTIFRLEEHGLKQ